VWSTEPDPSCGVGDLGDDRLSERSEWCFPPEVTVSPSLGAPGIQCPSTLDHGFLVFFGHLHHPGVRRVPLCRSLNRLLRFDLRIHAIKLKNRILLRYFGALALVRLVLPIAVAFVNPLAVTIHQFPTESLRAVRVHRGFPFPAGTELHWHRLWYVFLHHGPTLGAERPAVCESIEKEKDPAEMDPTWRLHGVGR